MTTTGERLRNEGMALAGENAPVWREIIRTQIFLCAKKMREVTGSIVQEALSARGYGHWKNNVSPNTLGAAFKYAEAQGWIGCTGETIKATHDSGHARRQMVWVSHLFGG